MFPASDSIGASRKRARVFPTLSLATQGKDAVHTKEAQYLLANNRYGIKFYDGPIDGVFTPAVADACKRAKFELGFPTSLCKGTFGSVFRSYLVKESHPAFKPRPRAYQKLQKQRAQKPFRVVCLEHALKEVGYVERPVNLTKFGAEYGENGVAWCAIFVSCMIGFQHFKYAYVPYVVADARAGRNHLHVTETPLPGDLVCFDWNKDGEADHIGFFGGWLDKDKGIFWTVEGNTSPDNSGDQSNGGGVYRRYEQPRYTSEVEVFVSYS